uniref:Keratinocyte associated protein 3 n=1 Tax=Latimeria chalumnae TaxID=7897 RepID=H3B0K3_LATCH
KGTKKLMQIGISLIFIGHINFILGAIVHGTVLRHVSKPDNIITVEYCVANIISVVSGLLSITTGIVAILVSRNLSNMKLHWWMMGMSLLNSLVSAACCVGLILAISLTVSNGGRNLLSGCNVTELQTKTKVVVLGNDCPFDTTRIYDTTLALWVPSMLLAALESAMSVRCLVVAVILRRLGVCEKDYLEQRLEEETGETEGLQKSSTPESHQLICTGG